MEVKMKKISIVVLLFISYSVIFSNTIKIGVITPLSGPIAIYGEAVLKGIQLKTEEINDSGGIDGIKVELIIEDNQGDSKEAVNIAKKMINIDGIQALLGPVISTNSLAVAPIMQEKGIPMITPTGTNSEITKVGDYIARTCFIDEFQGVVMANFASNNLDAKTAVSMIDLNSDYSKRLTEEFTKVFENNSGEIVAEVSYAANDVDFTSQLTKIKSKKPDVIFIPGYYNEVSLIVKQARDLKIDSVFLGGDGWDNGKLFKIAGDAINGSFINTHFSSESDDKDIQNFLKNYKDRFREGPSVLAALGYDAAGVMFEAIKGLDEITSENIKKAVNSTKNYDGITGTITIDENGNAQKSAFILKAQDGKFKYYDTVSFNYEKRVESKLVESSSKDDNSSEKNEDKKQELDIQYYFNLDIENLFKMKRYLGIDRIFDIYAYKNQEDYMLYKLIEGQIQSSLEELSIYIIKYNNRYEVLLKVEQPETAAMKINTYIPLAFVSYGDYYGLNYNYKQQFIYEQYYYRDLFLNYNKNNYYLATNLNILKEAEKIISKMDRNEYIKNLRNRKKSIIKAYSNSKIISENPFKGEFRNKIPRYDDMVEAIEKYFNKGILYIDFDSKEGTIIVKGESLDNIEDVSSEIYGKFPGEFIKVYVGILTDILLKETRY